MIDDPADPAFVADSVAAVVLSVPGVTALHAGAFGEVATYLAGRRVEGVRLTPQVTEVHVSVRMGTSVLATAEMIKHAVTPLVTTPVNVYIEDIDPT